MNNEEQFSGSQAPRSNKKLIGVIIVAALFMCGLMGYAGYSIGRASVTPQVELIPATVEEVEEESSASESTNVVSGENVGEVAEETAVSSEAQEEPPKPTEPATMSVDTAEEPTPQEQEPAPEPRLEDIEEIDFATFYEAWELVEEGFDGELPSNEEILYSAIEGSIEELDDEYTRFIRPEIAARLREDAQGAVEGIGAFVRETDEGFFEVVRPIPGQAAEKAGILPGDLVVGVDGDSVLDVSFDEVIMMVRGPQGTDVTLNIVREGEEEELVFTITRVRFEIPTVEHEMLDDDIAYIKLSDFNRTAYDKTVAAMEELLAQNPQGLIFDLRDNPGGFLNQSVSIADLFLDESVVLYERNRNGLVDETFTADDGDIGETIPMVVLVNGGSASASEIVAGAIKDHGRATLIGEQTFGKGSVQHVLTLSDGAELRVTIARWYTPNNNTIDKEGITPDIEVPMEFDAEEDIQLDRAIEFILTGE